jgi:hypothetical protein
LQNNGFHFMTFSYLHIMYFFIRFITQILAYFLYEILVPWRNTSDLMLCFRRWLNFHHKPSNIHPVGVCNMCDLIRHSTQLSDWRKIVRPVYKWLHSILWHHYHSNQRPLNGSGEGKFAETEIQLAHLIIHFTWK